MSAESYKAKLRIHFSGSAHPELVRTEFEDLKSKIPVSFRGTASGVQVNAFCLFLVRAALHGLVHAPEEDFVESSDESEYVHTLANSLGKKEPIVVSPFGSETVFKRVFLPKPGDNRARKHKDTNFRRIVRMRWSVLPSKNVQVIWGRDENLSRERLEELASYLLRQWSLGQREDKKTDAAGKAVAVIEVPMELRTMVTDFETPQWTRFYELPLDKRRLHSFRCTITTDSPYFRFGFKLLTIGGKVFGDGTIQSQDRANNVVHIGRNHGSRDVFLTTYRNGIREGLDKFLFKSAKRLIAKVLISIDSYEQLVFEVNGNSCYKCPLQPEVSSRMIMMAWGDHDEYLVRVDEPDLRVFE